MSDSTEPDCAPLWPWLVVAAEHRHDRPREECGCVPDDGAKPMSVSGEQP